MLVTPSRKIPRGRRGPTTERGALVSPPLLRRARLLVAACLRFHLTPGGLELLHALIQGNPGQCRALVARMRVVVEDDFAVQVVKCHGSCSPSSRLDAPASAWGKTACAQRASPSPARRCPSPYCTGTDSPGSSPTHPAVGATAACSGARHARPRLPGLRPGRHRARARHRA